MVNGWLGNDPFMAAAVIGDSDVIRVNIEIMLTWDTKADDLSEF